MNAYYATASNWAFRCATTPTSRDLLMRDGGIQRGVLESQGLQQERRGEGRRGRLRRLRGEPRLAEAVLGRRGGQLHHPRHAVQPGTDAGGAARRGRQADRRPQRSSTRVAVDARAPKFDGGIVTRLDTVRSASSSTGMGARFYDEGEDFWPKRYAIWGGLIARQPDQIAFSIVDAKAMSASSCRLVFPPVEGRIARRARRDATAWTRRHRRRPWSSTTAPPGRRPSTRRPSTTAPPRGSSRRRATGRCPSTRRRSGAIRFDPASPSPITASTVNDARPGHRASDEACPRRMFRGGRGHGRQHPRSRLPGRVRHDDRHASSGASPGREAAMYALRLDLINEGERQLTICNACRYCEGYCAVFPAMELRRTLRREGRRLSRQPLLRLPRLLLRLPVHAAARLRDQPAGGLRRDARRDLPGVLAGPA